VIGSRLTLAMVEAKLQEHRIKPYTLEVKEGDREQIGPFGCEFIAVNHSIPDALAVAIRTPAGLVLHTGDIKLDQLPLDGRLTDLAGFSRLGDEGVDLFLVDSTNAEVPGFVIAEREIGPVLDSVFHRSPARIIVACFASHVHRVQQVLDTAAAHGRRVCLVGRSMLRNMGLAAELGFLNVPDGLLVELDDALELPDEQLVIVSTGSHGEPLSALARMARGDHRSVRIRSEDTIILASSLIPGNESAVFGVINGLTRLGATVVHQGTAKVHVSGHAPAGELLFLYNAVRPSNVMPVHGEWRHLRANAALAVKTGCPRSRSCSPRTAWSSTWWTARRRSPGGSRSAGCTSTGSPSATSASPRWATGWCSARAASSRSRWRWTRPPVGRCPGRRCPGAGSPTTRRRWTRCCPWSRTS
jgi:ribonuclease J